MSLLASFSILLSTSSRKIKDSSGKAAKHCLSAAVVMILTTEYFVARTVALGERHRPKTLNSPKRTASAMLVTSMLMCLIPSWSWKCSGIHWIFPPMDPAYRKRVGGMYYILLLCSWNTLDYDLKSSIIINYMHLYASICIYMHQLWPPTNTSRNAPLAAIASYLFISWPSSASWLHHSAKCTTNPSQCLSNVQKWKSGIKKLSTHLDT